jgi:hypothetical protein
VNIVRKPEHVDLLTKIGAAYLQLERSDFHGRPD